MEKLFLKYTIWNILFSSILDVVFNLVFYKSAARLRLFFLVPVSSFEGDIKNHLITKKIKYEIGIKNNFILFNFPENKEVECKCDILV